MPTGQPDAKAVNSSLDKGIEGNLDAALIGAKLDHNVKFAVKNRVVTLTGEVNSDEKAQKVSASRRLAVSLWPGKCLCSGMLFANANGNLQTPSVEGSRQIGTNEQTPPETEARMTDEHFSRAYQRDFIRR